MKKYFLLLIFCAIPCSLLAISGLGTFASPYHGTITADTVWNTSSNKIYVNGTITVTAHLTINQGLTIVFVSAGANLIITGNGVLTASGGPGANMIRFTADFNNNGIYGETGERWGHISFENMGGAGASIIDSCIIEWGDVSGVSLPNRYGGGIHSSFSNLTISNCIIRNNKAGFGGGIFVNKNASPSISNCQIYNNTSSSSGGGLYIWSNSASIVTNCLIYSNTSTSGGGGGGIFLGDLCGNVRIYNSTIVNNSCGTNGKNIHLYVNTNPARPTFINCIVWNPANSIYYTSQTPSASDFVNCAIQSPSYQYYTNWVPLNASNSAPDGPNFNQTDGTDWSIQFISPCRDAGTNTGAPINDIIGNSRIWTTDIGAYENQYSRWAGTSSTAWETASNWVQSLLPGSSSYVVIPDVTNDPVIFSADVTVTKLITETGGLLNISANRLLTSTNVTNGGTITFQPNSKGTVTNFVNSGNLNLKSDATGTASFLVTNWSGTDANNIELYLTGGYIGDIGDQIGRWHYISSPVASLSRTVFTVNTLDLAQWVDGIQAPGDIRLGWVAYDGFMYLISQPWDTLTFTGPKFNTLTPGKGYNFWDDLSSFTYSLSGQLNTGNVSISLDYHGQPYENGFNLLGNPFTSAINWDDIINETYFPYPANTSKSLYFTRDNDQCSYASGVGDPSDVTGIIPPMQGFFVKTYSTGNTITFPAAARTHNGIHARYKGETIIPLVRLEVQEDSINRAETVVRFDENAKSTLDNDFDAIKMTLSSKKTYMYSTLGGVKYAINGQPFPTTAPIEIPIVMNLIKSGTHKISAINLEGLDSYGVFLKDNLNQTEINLKDNPSITFSSPAGLLSNRFVLFIDITTGIENPVVQKNNFNIYTGFDFINIQTLSDAWDGKPGSVRIIDITGKTVNILSNVEFSKNSLLQINTPSAKGLYIVELNSGAMRYVGKVIIK